MAEKLFLKVGDPVILWDTFRNWEDHKLNPGWTESMLPAFANQTVGVVTQIHSEEKLWVRVSFPGLEDEPGMFRRGRLIDMGVEVVLNENDGWVYPQSALAHAGSRQLVEGDRAIIVRDIGIEDEGLKRSYELWIDTKYPLRVFRAFDPIKGNVASRSRQYDWRNIIPLDKEFKPEAVKAPIPAKPKKAPKRHSLGVLLDKKRKAGAMGSLCSFAMRYPKTDKLVEHGICHAQLARGYDEDNADLLEVVLNLRRHYEEEDDVKRKEMLKEYYLWMMNESPWAPVIVTKTWQRLMRSGVYLDTNCSLPSILSTAVAFRLVTEFGSRGDYWYELVKQGVDKRVAWLMMQTMDKDGKFMSMGGGHDCMQATNEFDGVIKFMKGKGFYLDVKKVGGPAKTHEHDRKICGAMSKITAGGPNSWMSKFKAITPPVVVGEGWNQTSSYPPASIQIIIDHLTKLIVE